MLSTAEVTQEQPRDHAHIRVYSVPTIIESRSWAQGYLTFLYV